MAFDAVLVVGTHERRASAGHVGLVAFGTGLIFRAHLGVYDAVFAAVVADDTVFDLGALVMVVVIEGDGGASDFRVSAWAVPTRPSSNVTARPARARACRGIVHSSDSRRRRLQKRCTGSGALRGALPVPGRPLAG